MYAQPRAAMIALVSLLGTPALAGCGEDHTEGVSAAAVGAPETSSPERPVESPAAAGASSLPIARDRSSVGFTAAKVTASHDGSFSEWSGAITLGPGDDITQSRVEVTIQMGSLAIEPARLAAHLRTPDLLDVAAFPTATFRSTRIEAGSSARVGGAAATHTVTGDLTLHGQTRAISFPAIITVAPGEVSARAEFSIDRQDFGITYPGMPDDLIRDEVVIRFDVHAPRA